MPYRNFTIGVLAVMALIGSGVFYVTFLDQARIRIDEDKSTFYVKHEDYPWIWTVSGREYNRLFDGSSIMNRDTKGITIKNKTVNGEFLIVRTTPYQRGPIIRDTYFFKGNIEGIELFPIRHKVEVINAQGMFYRYTVDDLTETGNKRKLSSQTSLNFGRNMKVDFPSGYRWAWIGWPYGEDSFSAQYNILSDYEVFEVRLYDPLTDPDLWLYLNMEESAQNQNKTDEGSTGFGMIFNLTGGIFTQAGGIGDGSNSVAFSGNDVMYNSSGFGDMDTPVDSFTLEFYMQSDDTSVRNQVILSFNDRLAVGMSANSAWSSTGCTQDHGYVCLFLKNDTDSTWKSISTSSPINNGTRYRMTFNVNSSGMFFYVNGRLNNSASTRAVWNGGAHGISIGQANSGFNATALLVGLSDSGASSMFLDGLSYYSTQQGNPDAIANFSMNGFQEDKEYELGTTAYLNAISTGNSSACIEIFKVGYSPNYTCGGVGSNHSFNFTINSTTYSTFANGWEKSVNLSWNGTVNISLDNATELLYFKANISGADNATNVVIRRNDGLVTHLLEGSLVGGVLHHQLFFFEDQPYFQRNLTFSEGGIKTFYINYSMNSLDFDSSNASLNISSFDLNSDSFFDFKDNFSDNAHIASLSSVESPVTVFQTYEQNSPEILKGHDVSKGSSGSLNSVTSTNGITSGNYKISTSIQGSTGGSSGSAFNSDSLVYLDVSKISQFNLSYNFDLSCTKDVGGTVSSEAIVRVYDGVNSVLLKSDGVSCGASSSSSSDWQNVSIIRTANSDIWNLSIDGTYQGNVDTSSLDDSVNWTLLFRTSAATSNSQSTGNTASAIIQLGMISVGGSGLSWNHESVFSSLNGSFSSRSLNRTDNNVFAADFSYDAFSPEGTNISPYLSNDGGLTWEPSPDNETHIFTTVGSDVRVNFTFYVNNSVTNLSPIVFGYKVNVFRGLPDDVAFDFGSDGTQDYLVSFGGVASSLMITNSSDGLVEYALDNCNANDTVCSVPISMISSNSSVITISGIDVTQNLNPIVFNYSHYDNTTDISFDVNFDGSTIINPGSHIAFEGLDIGFRGSKNITVVAFEKNDRLENITRNINVRYSGFSKAFPANISSWQFFPRSREDKNLTPRGQRNFTPIRNVSSVTYDHTMNLSVYLNNSFSELVNFTLSNTSSKEDGLVMSTDPQLMCVFDVGDSCGLWNWLDLNITSSRFVIPQLWMCGICEDCVRTDDWCETNKVII